MTSYLCAIGYDGRVLSSGSSVARNPFDPTTTSASVCTGHLADVGAVALDTVPSHNIGSQSTGAGAGKITFNPVAVPAGRQFSMRLFQLQAPGTPIKLVLIAFRPGPDRALPDGLPDRAPEPGGGQDDVGVL